MKTRAKPRIDPQVSKTRATLAAATRDGDADKAANAKADLNALTLEAHIRKVVDAAPKRLRPEDAERLAALLRG